ncbi:MAG: hypothetical protein K6A23_06005 [Butyrivibrio sp.]|nr:hypothetical protein [Butyrivibrio sp.]
MIFTEKQVFDDRILRFFSIPALILLVFLNGVLGIWMNVSENIFYIVAMSLGISLMIAYVISVVFIWPFLFVSFLFAKKLIFEQDKMVYKGRFICKEFSYSDISYAKIRVVSLSAYGTPKLIIDICQDDSDQKLVFRNMYAQKEMIEEMQRHILVKMAR